ncbi:YggT family protein [Camelliibacillus cellulosilyticus]|uniref:YggT family protein n=1 Tax=Camelliibacillus cellulosilyticus TaxID=2174486 RepID=A0ABV9GN50_9BACL
MHGQRFFLARLLNVLLSLVQILIGLHIVLKLFGAANVPFVRWVNMINSPLLRPFRGIFHSIQFYKGFVLDLSAVFAFIIYSIIGYLLIKLSLMLGMR